MTDPEPNDTPPTRYIVERHDVTTAENESKMDEPDAIAPHDNFIEALDDALRLAKKQYNGRKLGVNTNTYPECIEFYEPGQPGCVRLRPAEMTTAYTEFDL